MFDAIGDFFSDIYESACNLLFNNNDKIANLQKKIQTLEKEKEKVKQVRDYYQRINAELGINYDLLVDAEKKLLDGGHCLDGEATPQIKKCLKSLKDMKECAQGIYEVTNRYISRVDIMIKELSNKIDKLD